MLLLLLVDRGRELSGHFPTYQSSVTLSCHQQEKQDTVGSGLSHFTDKSQGPMEGKLLKAKLGGDV